MRTCPTLVLAAVLAAGLDEAAAQSEKDLLPMSFVRLDSASAARLEADWHRMSAAQKEWAYCVTTWKLNLTQDHDTVFVITGLRRVTVQADRPHEIPEFACTAPNGLSMPIAHVHPGGDCTPSRADATYSVAYGTPFGLILCGPRATASYTGQQFLWISRGVLTERNANIAADSTRP